MVRAPSAIGSGSHRLPCQLANAIALIVCALTATTAVYTHEHADGTIMRITFDARKRALNLKSHGLDLADAGVVLMSELAVTFEDRRHDYGEARYVTLGPLADAIVAVVSTEVGTTARIISMRKATQHEKEIYYEHFH